MGDGDRGGGDDDDGGDNVEDIPPLRFCSDVNVMNLTCDLITDYCTDGD